MAKQHIAYLGVGSNLGDREAHLLQAKNLLSSTPDIEMVATSSVYETEPWPKHEVKDGRELSTEKQGWHLNQVFKIRTALSASLLLETIQSVEKEMGKSPMGEWGSRIIDIDIVLYDDLIVEEEGLKVPHPFMTDRQFVLVPLLELDSDLTDPRTGERYQLALDKLSHEHEVKLFTKS